MGQAVADQLAGDSIARALKRQRQLARQQREWERRHARANGGASSDHEQSPSEEEAKERRRREREAEQEARRPAAAHNLELGAAVVDGFARIGCSDWNYDDWRGRLYPEGLGRARWLGRYAPDPRSPAA